MRSFSKRLQSKEHLIEVIKLFGFDNIEEFRKKYMEIEKKRREGTFREYRYNGCFEGAPVMFQYIQSSELGTVK